MNSQTVHERLLAQGFREHERWRIANVLSFVQRELSMPAWPLQLTFALLGFAVLFGVTKAYWDIEDGARWIRDIVVPFGAGAFAMLVIVVPHELLHGLAYKLTGAPRIKYGADLRRLVFHASAPYHAITARQLYFVAMLPGLLLSALLVVWLCLLGGWWWWFGFGLLLMHTQGSLGDVAMVSFFVRQAPGTEWMTYDASDTEEFVLLVRGESSSAP